MGNTLLFLLQYLSGLVSIMHPGFNVAVEEALSYYRKVGK